MFDSGMYTSSSIKRLRKRLKETDNKDEARLTQIKDAVDIWIAVHYEKIKKGSKVNVADFERMVKMQLLLMDKPTDIVENRTDVEEVEEVQMKEISNIPEFQSLKDQIAAMMNAKNEEGKRKQ